MPAPVNASELLEQLRHAQLLTQAEVDSVRLDIGATVPAHDLADLLVHRGLLTQYQADEATKGFAHDLVLGPYRIMDPLGQGGMGGVFKAMDSRLKRVVALKMIRDDLVQNELYVKRFRREAEAVAQIMHPNVVVIYDVGEVNGTHYLAMEYVEGQDLYKMVQQQGVLPIQTACEFVRQAALGLSAAHDRGLVHRDIKPANLLVTRAVASGLRSGPLRLSSRPGDTPSPSPSARAAANVVKILDLGLVRDTEAGQSTLTQVGTIVGTPDFIAPEQAQDASTVDHRADIYSLGCTFYYLLTGGPPFPDGSPFDKLKKHASPTATPRPVEETRRGLPPDVARIVYRMMAKAPDHRYQSAHDVAEDLADVQRKLFSGALVRTGSNPEMDLKAAAAASAAETIRPKPADTLPAPTYAIGLDSVVIRARQSAAIAGHKGYVTALAFSPDGRILASGGVDDVVRLWNLGPMHDQAGARPAELTKLSGRLGEVQAIAFDPTGTYLVTGSANTEVGPMCRWDWRDNDPSRARTTVPSQPIQVDAMAFNRDGTRLAATVRDGIFIWGISPRKGMTKEKILRGHNTLARAIAFHPDGTRLALGGEDTTVRIIEFGWLRNSVKPALTGHTDAITSLAYSQTGNLLVTGSKDGTIRLWDGTGNDSKARAVMTGHTQAVRLVRFTPRGNQLVSVGDGGQVHLWDIATQAPVREWAIEKTMAHSIALSPDGRYLAVGTADRGEGLVSLYDLELIMVEQLAPTAAGV